MKPFKRRAIRIFIAFVPVLLITASLPALAQGAAPAWKLTANTKPTDFAPGAVPGGPDTGGAPFYEIHATNVGGAASSGPITISTTLPAGVTPDGAIGFAQQPENGDGVVPCVVSGQNLTCTTTKVVPPGAYFEARVSVFVDNLAEGTVLQNESTIAGGGAPTVSATTSTLINSDPPDFDFTDGDAGVSATFTDSNGQPVTQAGSHPFRATIDLGFSAELLGGILTGAQGGVRDVVTELPPGLVVNPAATPVRCTEDQLEVGACPTTSQVGVVTLGTIAAGSASVTSSLYNMVPPDDAPALLGFDAAGAGIFVHIDGGVRPGDYALTATSTDNLARPSNPAFSAQVQLWGDPSNGAHNAQRGSCSFRPGFGCTPGAGGSDQLPPYPVPFLTMPTACSNSLPFTARANSWQDPDNPVERTEPIRDSFGNPVPVTGCESVPFEPEIDLDPTTTRADSPAGMDVSLDIPQPQAHETLASAHLKRAVVTLPEGMSLNPSASDGLDSCSTAEVGLTSANPIRFDLNPHQCPAASKVGSATIHTPLLPDPLEAELFLADQDDNPFDALLSGYLVAQGHGLAIKIAGEFETDPQTGQIKAIFNNNPQQPFSELELHFKGGPRGVLVTPPTCGIYTIESKLSSWAAVDPQNPTPAEVVTDTSTFTVDSAPDGGPCQAGDPDEPADPADRADRPFAPGFSAGVVTPNAGSSSPFVLRATRQDGEQEITRLSGSLPPGLTAKLAGVPQCSEAAINSIPTALGTGAAEKASPSCPAGSLIGTTRVGAGAGSQLTYIPGNVYLAGPYQGAPLSLATVTPAVTGPFDLGNVVTRTKLLIDQDDAQVHAISDPLPTILEGIPLHIRDIRVIMDRPGFIQTPTNCSPMSVTGSLGGGGGVLASTADDISASVSDRFQVSGCGGLGFSPKLSGQILNGQDGIHRSDHPNLLFDLKGTPGDANMSRVEVTLPQNFQIDQANLGNICSETQLATQDCAGRQRVGTASAITPLLDTPLSGPVYAVSGSGGLPKLALILYGPPSMPIKLVVRGVTETVGARIKNTFPLVPDAPVSSFALNLDGGDKGYLVNNSDLCGSSSKGKKSKKKKGKGKRSTASAAKKKKGKKKSRSSAGIAADATFFGQNGDTLSQSVPISAECGGGGGKKGKGGKKRKGKRRG